MAKDSLLVLAPNPSEEGVCAHEDLITLTTIVGVVLVCRCQDCGEDLT